ncbi:MAG: NAD+ synthase [Fimbriimonadia bacterium]
MPLKVHIAPKTTADSDEMLRINPSLVADWLVAFLRSEVRDRRGFENAVLGVSGGVDSALVAFLCVEAFGPEHVYLFKMPYSKVSSHESVAHADMVIGTLGCHGREVDITAAVDGYVSTHEPDISPARLGNVCARQRMIVLFDQAAKLSALPIGTGNKTERLMGYFTWHADDSPPINPIGDLFKTQVWQLARHVGVPDVIVEKPASADLIKGQTDEDDLGISYVKLDRILYHLLRGVRTDRLTRMGFRAEDVEIARARLDSTHWKRHLPTVCVLSDTAIGEYYLRPVDY